MPAVQSPSHTRGTLPPPFDYDARQRLLAVLSLPWLHALLPPSAQYSDALMYRLWLLCDGLVDSLLVRLARFKTHPPFASFGALIDELAKYDSRRLPSLTSFHSRNDEKTVMAGSDNAAAWGSPASLVNSIASVTVQRPTSEWGEDEEEDLLAAAFGVQSPRLSRTSTLPALHSPSVSPSLPYRRSASPALSSSPSASPTLAYTALSKPSSPSPHTRSLLPLVAPVTLTSCPPLVRSVSAHSGLAVEAVERPHSRQQREWQRSWTRSDLLQDGTPQPQVNAVREED